LSTVTGLPDPSRYANREYVVPRSIPIDGGPLGELDAWRPFMVALCLLSS
jgi:hypothetical protein